MDPSPNDTARYRCCNCRSSQVTCDPSDAPKMPVQPDDSIKELSESTSPTLPLNTSTPTLPRSATDQEKSHPTHSNRSKDNAVKSSTSEGYKNQDTPPSELEIGAAPARATRFPQVSPEMRRFLLFIFMGLLFIPFSFVVRSLGNLDSSQTVGVLQVSVVFFVELAKMFPWV